MEGEIGIIQGHESGGGRVRITLGHEKEGDINTHIKTNKNTQLGTQKNNKIKMSIWAPNKEIM
jgi:hypothetical protein